MALRKSFTPQMRKLIDRQVQREVQKLREAEPAISGRDEDVGWRRITKDERRDLPTLTQERMQKVAAFLYDSDPLAHRILETKKDYIIGEGVTFSAEDKDVQALLEEFWNDPVNAWDLKQHSKALEIGLFGEQAYPVFTNEQNGFVRLGYLDPAQIDRVITNPENVEEPIALKRKDFAYLSGITDPDEEAFLKSWASKREFDLEAEPKKFYETISLNPKTGFLEGETFLFTVNKVSNATRGRSDLLTLADWVSIYDQFLFARAERAKLQNVFLWDVMFTGWTQEKCEEWARKHPVPKSMTVRAHNEKVKWDVVSPRLESSDASEEAKLIRQHILAGAGFPPHWFAGGEGLTRATALEASSPVFKQLRSRQSFFKYMLAFIFRFTIDQAIKHQRWGPGSAEKSKRFELALPRLSEKDVANLSGSLSSIASAMTIAVETKLVGLKDAQRVFAFMVSLLGMEVKPPAEGELVAEKQSKDDFKDDSEYADELKKLGVV